MADESIAKASPDWEAMSEFWTQVDTIMGGACTMRAAGEKYLPKFPNETTKDYDFRLASAKFTNVYRDIVESLASKPFAKEFTLEEGAPERFMELAEDIDGRGNNLHVFAMSTFFDGINRAVDWILVDYAAGSDAQTVEDERKAGARPYWVHVPASAVIDVQSQVVAGREQITLFKIRESEKRIRLFERMGDNVKWTTFDRTDKGDWIQNATGPVTIGVIPVVPFATGRRKGSKWQWHPPMRDAADLQIELYQQESGLKHIKTLTCFPMLAGNGVSPDVDGDGRPKPVPVGPQAVLYAPPNADGSHGEWKWIITDAATLKFLADDVQETIRQLRELGRQPLTAQSGNLTVVTTAFAAQKGNSAVQNWALCLKDAIEQAWKLTAMWLNEDVEPEVVVFTDFGVEAADGTAPALLVEMWKGNNEGRALSGVTLRSEMKRYGVLGADFSEDEEVKRLLAEMGGDDTNDSLP